MFVSSYGSSSQTQFGINIPSPNASRRLKKVFSSTKETPIGSGSEADSSKAGSNFSLSSILSDIFRPSRSKKITEIQEEQALRTDIALNDWIRKLDLTKPAIVQEVKDNLNILRKRASQASLYDKMLDKFNSAAQEQGLEIRFTNEPVAEATASSPILKKRSFSISSLTADFKAYRAAEKVISQLQEKKGDSPSILASFKEDRARLTQFEILLNASHAAALKDPDLMKKYEILEKKLVSLFRKHGIPANDEVWQPISMRTPIEATPEVSSNRSFEVSRPLISNEDQSRMAEQYGGLLDRNTAGNKPSNIPSSQNVTMDVDTAIRLFKENDGRFPVQSSSKGKERALHPSQSSDTLNQIFNQFETERDSSLLSRESQEQLAAAYRHRDEAAEELPKIAVDGLSKELGELMIAMGKQEHLGSRQPEVAALLGIRPPNLKAGFNPDLLQTESLVARSNSDIPGRNSSANSDNQSASPNKPPSPGSSTSSLNMVERLGGHFKPSQSPPVVPLEKQMAKETMSALFKSDLTQSANTQKLVATMAQLADRAMYSQDSMAKEKYNKLAQTVDTRLSEAGRSERVQRL